MNQEMFAQLNAQVSNELYNSFVYLSISNFYYQQKMNGLGKHYKQQYEDERSHAQKFIDYLLKFELGNTIELPVASPANTWDDLFVPLDRALALEQTTTTQIDKLTKLAISFEDFATQELLQWFSKEQVNEEFEANTMIAQAKLNGSYDELALRLLNDKLDS